jgi:hypothetical protein
MEWLKQVLVQFLLELVIHNVVMLEAQLLMLKLESRISQKWTIIVQMIHQREKFALKDHLSWRPTTKTQKKLLKCCLKMVGYSLVMSVRFNQMVPLKLLIEQRIFSSFLKESI